MSTMQIYVNSKPSQKFMDWSLTCPNLTEKDKQKIEQFYKEKVTGYQVDQIKHRNYCRAIYNKYVNYFNVNEELVLLDEFFVDETCVWFLYYNSKLEIVKYAEIMLD